MTKHFLFLIFCLAMAALATSCQEQAELMPAETQYSNARLAVEEQTLRVTQPVVLDATKKRFKPLYEELVQEMTKWVLHVPSEVSPLTDPDGSRHAERKQPVSYAMILNGNFGGATTRSVTIPRDRLVFIPIASVTGWYYKNDACDPDFVPAPGQSDQDFLDAFIADPVNGITNMSAKFDGEEIVPNLKQHLFKSSVFKFSPADEYNFPECDYSNKKAITVSHSYCLLMKLPRGHHTLTFSATFQTPGYDDFVVDMTWNLDIL